MYKGSRTRNANHKKDKVMCADTRTLSIIFLAKGAFQQHRENQALFQKSHVFSYLCNHEKKGLKHYKVFRLSFIPFKFCKWPKYFESWRKRIQYCQRKLASSKCFSVYSGVIICLRMTQYDDKCFKLPIFSLCLCIKIM